MCGVKRAITNNAKDWYSAQLMDINGGNYFSQTSNSAIITISSSCGAFKYSDCIASCIESGSFGFVYRGVESSTGKPVAYHTVDGTLSPHNLRRLIDNVVRGYNALYDCCIVHCDIKPQNILIIYREQNLIETAKISDFGISRILNDEEQKSLSNVAGTLYYIAPEVPFDERELCRMFLFVACDNYDAYNKPELSFGIDENITGMVSSQLEIDSTK